MQILSLMAQFLQCITTQAGTNNEAVRIGNNLSLASAILVPNRRPLPVATTLSSVPTVVPATTEATSIHTAGTAATNHSCRCTTSDNEGPCIAKSYSSRLNLPRHNATTNTNTVATIDTRHRGIM